jgi:hypothetical protein
MRAGRRAPLARLRHGKTRQSLRPAATPRPAGARRDLERRAGRCLVSVAIGQADLDRSLLAERILKAARDGERDPVRLRARAITGDFDAG